MVIFMSKVTKAILMLNILQNKRKWQISELSERLEVTGRMVRNYKACLEDAGFKILTIKGKNGGYVLESSNFNERLNFTDEDIAKLTLLSKKEGLEDILDKVKSNYYYEKNKYYYSILNISNRVYEQKETDFINAIVNKKKIKIIYIGSSEKITIRVVEPIDIFCYEKDIYLQAFCELRQSIRNFELSRIKSYDVE